MMNPEKLRTYVFTLASGRIERVVGDRVVQTKTHLEVWSRSKEVRLAAFLLSEVATWDLERPDGSAPETTSQ
jgi:hypothetical protein